MLKAGIDTLNVRSDCIELGIQNVGRICCRREIKVSNIIINDNKIINLTGYSVLPREAAMLARSWGS